MPRRTSDGLRLNGREAASFNEAGAKCPGELSQMFTASASARPLQ